MHICIIMNKKDFFCLKHHTIICIASPTNQRGHLFRIGHEAQWCAIHHSVNEHHGHSLVYWQVLSSGVFGTVPGRWCGSPAASWWGCWPRCSAPRDWSLSPVPWRTWWRWRPLPAWRSETRTDHLIQISRSKTRTDHLIKISRSETLSPIFSSKYHLLKHTHRSSHQNIRTQRIRPNSNCLLK